MRIVTLQPSARTDHIAEDGTEMKQLPYPFHVNESGEVGRQDFWRGDPVRVVGFAADLARQEVDVWWSEVWADPDRAVGMYAVVLSVGGGLASMLSAIESVRISEVRDG